MSATTLSPSKAVTGSGPSRLAKEIFAEIQAKFRLEQAEFVRLYKGTNSGDVVSLEEFIRITKSLWIHLEKSEIEFISANFASGIDGKLNWTKFVKKLDILPPDDFSEPDRFLDPLPEPLAGIIEILELEIIDAAWLEIIRLHPEIPIDSSGNSIVVRRNRNLEVLVSPSTLDRQARVPVATAGASLGEFAVYHDGSISIMNTSHGHELHNISIFKVGAGIPFGVFRLSNAVTVFHPVDPPCVRVIAYKVTEIIASKPPPEAEASAAPAGKKAPPPKGKAAVVEEKEAPPAAPERKFEIEIRVVDAALGTSVRTVTEATILTVSTLNVKINLSMDGRVFCVTHGDKSAVFLIAGVALADTKAAGVSTTSAAVGLANIPEDRYPSVTEVHLYECKQVALINLTEILSSDNSKSVAPIWNCIVVGSTAANAPLPLDALSFPARNYKFILIPEHKAKWFLVEFSVYPPQIQSAATPPPQTQPPAKGAAAAAPVAAASASPDINPPPLLWRVLVQGSWRLTAAVSAAVVDESRAALALGTADGVVTLWDVSAATLTSTCGQHSSAVTSLCFAQGNAMHLLCSGATDGTVCFYSINKRSANTTNDSIGSGATALIDMRNDVPKSTVATIVSINSLSLVMCHFNDGTVALYDAEIAHLLGKAVLYVGMQAQLSTSRPVNAFEMLQRSHQVPQTESAFLSTSMSFDVTDGQSHAVAALSAVEAPSINFGESTPRAPGVPDIDSAPSPANQIKEFLGSSVLDILSGSDCSGFSVFYHELSKKSNNNNNNSATGVTGDIVRAAYSADKVIEIVYPGIAGIRRSIKERGATAPPASVIFRTLTAAQRTDPNLSHTTLAYDSSAPSNTIMGTKSAASNKRALTSKNRKQSDSNALTEEHLRAHDNFNFSFKSPFPQLDSFASASSKDTLQRRQLGSSSIKGIKNQTESAKRKIDVNRRLKEMMGYLPSS